ncbi:unnamed protein product [Spirodela intermedia]|uniref:Reverse transcriptase Ty1/copia-type domain-containing protein n=1 Tax=Spirodela intermedia TaxID=51605 RepID=A0A7I8KUN6_SPIIN|nr:unnamed protein product [Spirodela intermedia]
MNEDMKALRKNDTWELVRLPIGKKVVGCKWVYTIKYHSDGSIERYKARLVAKGYTQTYGVDYLETFAPVAKMNIIILLLSLAINSDWNLQQFDVKNALLHGELEEKSYMEVPHGYERNSDANIYMWTILLSLEMMMQKKNFDQYLSQEFEMKTLGRLKYFLDIEVAYSKNSIFLSQQKYAAYHVLHFLKGTPGKDILFKKHDYLTLEVYTDADYAGSIVDR